MKKILLLITAITFISCSSNEKEEDNKINNTTTYDKLKAYNKNVSFYFYSSDPNRNGISRIYLDTISGLITQYTSNRQKPNTSDTSELFGVKKSLFYKNHNNSNIDYIEYQTNNNGLKILFGHEKNTDKFTFKRFESGETVIFKNEYPNGEFYKKLN